MAQILDRPSSLFVSPIAKSGEYVLDIGGTFNSSNLLLPPNIIDQISLANDWKIIGDELRKVMNAYE